MNKFEIYIDRDVKPILKKYKNMILDYIDKNHSVITNNYTEVFKKILIKIKNSEFETQIKYIQFSFLNHKIRENKFEYLLECFGHKWYFEESLYTRFFKVDWLSDFLNKLHKELIESSRKYMGFIDKSFVEKIVFIEVEMYKNILKSLSRYSVLELVNLKEFNENDKKDEINVIFGEFRGEFEKVFVLI